MVDIKLPVARIKNAENEMQNVINDKFWQLMFIVYVKIE